MILIARDAGPSAPAPEAVGPPFEAILERTEELVAHQALLACLGPLAARRRAVIVLRYHED